MMTFEGPQGHKITASSTVLRDGNTVLTVKGYDHAINGCELVVTPQALYAVAKKIMRNPKRIAVGGSREINPHVYSAYVEKSVFNSFDKNDPAYVG